MLDSKLKLESIVNGFKRCGLCLFDQTAIDYSKVSIMNQPQNDLEVTDTELPCSEGSVKHTNKECLKFFEDLINLDVLIQFNETYKKFTPIWNKEVEFQALYVAWK